MATWFTSAKPFPVVFILSVAGCFVNCTDTHTHTLQYQFTVTSGGKVTAVGLMDEEQFVYYDSDIRTMIPKTEWIKNITADDPQYWDRETERVRDQQYRLRGILNRLKQSLNQTSGSHRLQRMYGCEVDDDDDDGRTRGYDEYGYDGEDFIKLNLTTGTWTAVTRQAENITRDWESTGHKAQYWKNYLKTDCIDWLKKYKSLERKVRPEVSLFQTYLSSAVVCHATGFFPKTLSIFWQKDGEDVNEDVEFRETLPNPDGSFQKRIILTVPAEELQKHTYTCVVQHSSLEKNLVVGVPKDGGTDGGEGRIGLIIGGVGVVALIVIVIMCMKMKSGRTLIEENTDGELNVLKKTPETL